MISFIRGERHLTMKPQVTDTHSPVFSGVFVTRSLVLYVGFVDYCLSFCTFGHCVVCSSSIYGFKLPPFGIIKLFLVQTPLTKNYQQHLHSKQIIDIDDESMYRIMEKKYCINISN